MKQKSIENTIKQLKKKLEHIKHKHLGKKTSKNIKSNKYLLYKKIVILIQNLVST